MRRNVTHKILKAFVCVAASLAFLTQQAAYANVYQYAHLENEQSGRFAPRYLQIQQQRHQSIIGQKNTISEELDPLARNSMVEQNKEEPTPLKRKKGANPTGSKENDPGSKTYEFEDEKLYVKSITYEEALKLFLEYRERTSGKVNIFDFDLGGEILTLVSIDTVRDKIVNFIGLWDGNYFIVDLNMSDASVVSADPGHVQDKYSYRFTDRENGIQQYLMFSQSIKSVFNDMTSDPGPNWAEAGSLISHDLLNKKTNLEMIHIDGSFSESSDNDPGNLPGGLITGNIQGDAGPGIDPCADIAGQAQSMDQAVLGMLYRGLENHGSDESSECRLESVLDLIAFITDPKMLEILERIFEDFAEIKEKTLELMGKMQKYYHDFWKDSLKGLDFKIEENADLFDTIEAIERHLELIKNGDIDVSPEKLKEVLSSYNKMREEINVMVKEYLNELRSAKKAFNEISRVFDGSVSRVYKNEEDGNFKAFISLQKKTKPRKKPKNSQN